MLKKYLLLTGIMLSALSVQAMELEQGASQREKTAPHPVVPALDNDFWGKDFGVNPAPTAALERDITAYYVGKKQKLAAKIEAEFGKRDPVDELHQFVKSGRNDAPAYAKLLREAAVYHDLTKRYKKASLYSESFCDVNGLVKKLMHHVEEHPTSVGFNFKDQELDYGKFPLFPFSVWGFEEREAEKIRPFFKFLKNQLKIYTLFDIEGHSLKPQDRLVTAITLFLQGTILENKIADIPRLVQEIVDRNCEENFGLEKMQTACFVMEEFIPEFMSTLTAVHEKSLKALQEKGMGYTLSQFSTHL